jgi:hypothetical protein
MLTLVCHDNVPESSGQTLRIDFATSTVNGLPAKVTDALIWWSESLPSFDATYTIDRYSGSYQIDATQRSNGANAIFNGKCELATARRF